MKVFATQRNKFRRENSMDPSSRFFWISYADDEQVKVHTPAGKIKEAANLQPYVPAFSACPDMAIVLRA